MSLELQNPLAKSGDSLSFSPSPSPIDVLNTLFGFFKDVSLCNEITLVSIISEHSDNLM